MNLFGLEIRRSNRIAELEKSLADEARARVALQAQVQTLEQQAVRVSDLSEMAQRVTGQQQANSSAFPFGPLSPLPPHGTVQEQSLGPRRWQYPVGANVQFTPRQSEQVSFEALRNFARLYDVARICIQVRKEELQGLAWKITTKDDGREDEFRTQIAEVTNFFQKPDRRNTFDDWLGLLVEDIFVIDALTLHKQFTRGKELHALRVVDGATIHPVIDEVGDIYGYQQIIYGVPRTAYIDAQYATAMPDVEKTKAIFPLSQLIYRPRVQIPDSLYGFPPLEWVIMSVNQALRKQVSDLTWFTEGNTPEGFISMPDGVMGLEQAKAFEDDFNALLAGNDKMRRRLRFLPWNATITIPRAFTTDTAWDEFLLKKTCAAIGVSPQEIGFTADVNKATGEMQENVQSRRSTEPLTQFFESMLTEVIELDFGYTELKFSFHVQRAEEDILKIAQADEIYIRSAATSIDEVRSKRNLGKPFGIDRPFITTPLGVTYLDDALGTHGSDNVEVATKSGEGRVFTEAELREAARAEKERTGKSAEQLIAEKSALQQWRENSLNRIKQGKRPKLEFESDALSADTRERIVRKLQGAQTADEVRSVFDAILAQQGFFLTKSRTRDIREPQRRAKLRAEQEIQAALAEFWAAQGKRIWEHLKNVQSEDT